jgi:hypothetical protein
MSFTVTEVIKRHRELTSEIAAVSARHDEELSPLQEKKKAIEAWLLAKMSQDEVQNYKTEYGTAYQLRLSSVKTEDAGAFKTFILRPAADKVADFVSSFYNKVAEKDLPPGYFADTILDMLKGVALWDLVDFRPGKKAIVEYQTETRQAVPGVSLSEIVNVNIRG